MARSKARRWGLISLAVLLVIAVGAVVGFRLALGVVKGKIVEALGPGSQVAGLEVGWSSVDVVGLRILGPKGWPAEDALRAERVSVVPSLRSLLGGEVRVTSITVAKPYISALRTKDGKLRVVPSLLEQPARKEVAGSAGSVPPVHIGRIVLADGVAELFDASVAQPPQKIRLEQLQATLKDILVPALTGRTAFDVAGVVKGVKRDGRATVGGWAEVATKDSSVKVSLRGVDLVAFQPYLSQAADVRVRQGALDLDLTSDVRKNQLKAPGTVTLADLELAPAQGALGSFMGMSRSAVLGAMKDKQNRIAVKFVLEGDISNPKFSLNEALSTRLGASMAESLGVSLRGVAEGAGGLGMKGADAVGQAAKSVGESLGKLFGGPKK
jgi:uncharacterized protein involved in outer membrane biogenesis